ncbi:MAG: lamin tail domain-containing protein, partial [Patescibacteria group bacterium]
SDSTYLDSKIEGTIPAYGFYYFAPSASSFAAAADEVYSADSNRITNNNGLKLLDAGGNEIDTVWWGNVANFDPARSAPNPPTGLSLVRKFDSNNEILDSDDNSVDFELADSPNPQNSSSPSREPMPPDGGDPDPPPSDTIPPANPTDLAARPALGSITFTWTPPVDSDLLGFQIFINGSLDSVLGASTTNFTKTGLSGETEVNFLIKAFDDSNNFSAGAALAAKPLVAATIADPGELIFNEIAWAGSSISSSDEWLELKNTTSDKIFDLTDWKITGAGTGGADLIISSGFVRPGEFFLIANNSASYDFTAGQAALAVEPDFASSSLSLSNSALQIVLRDSAGNSLDSAGTGGAPLAGDSISPASMVRLPDLSGWVTAYRSNNFDPGRTDLGSPRAANFLDHDLAILEISSVPTNPLPGETTIFTVQIQNQGLNVESFDLVWKIGDAEVAREPIEDLASLSSIERAFPQNFEAGDFAITAQLELAVDLNPANNSQSQNLKIENHLLINEFVPDPVGLDATQEWIELFNPTADLINLQNFELNGSSISGLIEPNQYLVFQAKDWVGWNALGSSSGSVVLKDQNGQTLDSKNYTSAVESKSFGRDSTNLNAWQEFWHPTLGSANIFPENNSVPLPLISIQGSGNTTGTCALFVNLTAENSSDQDGDALEFEWDFGNGHDSEEENPAGFHFGPGTFTVRLTAIDSLGASAEAIQVFKIAECGGGGGSTLVTSSTAAKAAEPIYNSISADRVQLKINEVAFNSDPDWVEVSVVDDGNDGAGIDLGGFYFEDDKRIKTIRPGTILKTGEFLILEFKSDSPTAITKGQGFTKIFSDRSGLTATDEQIVLKDSSGQIEDAVVWENQDGKWSRGEEADVADLVAAGAWISGKAEAGIDSSKIKRGVVLARDSALPDSDSAIDWFATSHATPGSENPSRPVRAHDFQFLFSEIAPKNPSGDFVEIICPDCSEPVSLSGFSLRNGMDSQIFNFPENATIATGAPVKIIFGATEAEFADGIFYSTCRGLVGSDGLLTLQDLDNQTADFVGWTDRVIPPLRTEYDLALPQSNQLAKRFQEAEWISAEVTSLLDSRTLQLGASFVRQDSLDSNSAVDWTVHDPDDAIQIKTMTGAVRISEILPNPIGSDAGNEWFELVNLGSEPVNLFGWGVAVADNPFEFEENILLAPGEFRAFRGLLSLPNSASEFFLMDFDGVLVDSINYPKLGAGIAFAQNHAGNFAETELPTPDAPNGFYRILKPSEDSDGDGLADSAEEEFQTDPENFDTDGDGLPDFFETQNGSDPLLADATAASSKKYRAELAALAVLRLESSIGTQGFSLTGVGVPGGRMRIYIQSELKIIEVPIDENGVWNYSLDQALEVGNHNIFMQLVDPAGIESLARKVLNFDLAAAFTPPVFADTVRISEILPDPAGADAASEFIELENFGSEPANLSDFRLSVGRKKFTFPQDSIIPAGGLLALTRSQSSLALPNAGGSLALAWPTGRVIASLAYKKIKSGVAFAFDGSEFLPTKTPTPGLANVILAPPKKNSKKPKKYRNGNLSEQIRISEILANPVGDDAKTEFIELQNCGSTTVNLGNWRISDNKKNFLIPDSVFLRPGEFKTLSRSLTKISLNNSGREKVQVADFRGKVIDSFEFESPAEGIALAFDGSEIRATRILTAGSPNQFDSQKIVGKIEFRGEDGFVVQTDQREVFVRFGESGSALLARAIFQEGSRYEIFTKPEKGEQVLVGFQPDLKFLRTDSLALDLAQKNSKPAWPFTLLVFGVILLVLRFAKLAEAWSATKASSRKS